MKIISHRGNLNGKLVDRENTQSYIEEAMSCGVDVEIDIWSVGGKLFLGHDEPTYLVEEEWIETHSSSLWIHGKNQEAIEKLVLNKNLNVFWHENDKMTFTSKGFMWLYPGNYSKQGITVVLDKKEDGKLSEMLGVCTDYPLSWR